MREINWQFSEKCSYLSSNLKPGLLTGWNCNELTYSDRSASIGSTLAAAAPE